MSSLSEFRDLTMGRLALGDRLGEAFYAVWMVVVSMGILNSGMTVTPALVAEVVMVCFVVNIVWGIIDGTTVMYTNLIERTRMDRVVHDLRAGRGAARAEALAALDGTIAGALDAAEKARIVDRIAAGPAGIDPRTVHYRPGRLDWLDALGILVIDVIIAIPLVAPLVLIPDPQIAVYVSRLLATAALVALGWAYARSVHGKPWIAGVFLGALGFAIFTFAYEIGW